MAFLSFLGNHKLYKKTQTCKSKVLLNRATVIVYGCC